MGDAIGLSMPRTRRAMVWGLGAALVGSIGVVLLISPASSLASVPSGALSQLTGSFNCVGEVGYPGPGEESLIGCGTLLPEGAVKNSYQAQVSPDGRFVYSVAVEGDLVEYARNLANGELTPIGCITVSSESCAPENVTTGALEMKGPQALAISPSGTNVYVVTFDDVLVEFERNTETGLLTEESCIGHEATSACAIKGAKGLNEPYGVTVSHNGMNVYVASNADGAVAEFSRDTTTGELTQLPSPNNCISSQALSECGTVISGHELERSIGIVESPDEHNVYVAAGATAGEGAIVALERDESEEGALKLLPSTEACVSEVLSECAPGIEINGPEDLVISPDGENVYANSFKDNAVLEFKREASGALTQLPGPNACVMNAPAAAECTEGKGLKETLGVAISPNGENVYVSSWEEDDEAAFSRNTMTGALTQLPAPYECLGKAPPTMCETTGVKGIARARRVTVSPDGTNLYVAGQKDHSIVELARAVVPVVSEVNTNSGPDAGGTEVTVRGTGFAEGDTVAFGPEPAASVEVQSAETLVAKSPHGSGDGPVDVTVTSQAGTSTTGSNDQFFYGLLGGLDMTSYCGSLGYEGRNAKGEGPAVTPKGVTGPEYAYNNWVCVEDDGTEVAVPTAGPAPSMDNACAAQHSGVESHAIAENPDNAYSWNCYEGSPPSEESKGGGEENKGGGGNSGNESTAKTASVVGPIVPPAIVVPPPVLAKTGNVAPVSGAVSVKVPGTSKFVPLATLEQVPFGSVIEATQGHVSVTVALPNGKTETGEFFSGEFVLRQGPNGEVIAELTGGNFAVCPTRRERAHRAGVAVSGKPRAQTATSGSHVVRKLWANAHGKFETNGNYAAGAVQGTEWLTEDLCDGTLIKVTRDKVAVTNLVNHRKVEVKKGRHYLAKAP